MRQQFEITIDFYDDDENLNQKVFKVTPNFAARRIVDERLGGPLGFFLRHQNSNFSSVTISEITCFAWAVISGSGYDVSEEELGEHFNDMGEVHGLSVILPILTYWVNRVAPTKKKKKPTASRKKRTKSR